jgi:hypothetical protein
METLRKDAVDKLEESDRRALRRRSDRKKSALRSCPLVFTARSTTLLQFSNIGLDANGTSLRVALR